MIVAIVAILAIGLIGTFLLLLSSKSEADREYEDECQSEYLLSLNQKKAKKRLKSKMRN